MIDVQVILRDTETWSHQCFVSLRDEPVRLHIGRHIEGNVNAARMAVWDRCGGDLLSFADPDDEVVPGAYGAILEALGDTDGAYTQEQRINVAGEVTYPLIEGDVVKNPLVAHHVLVVRRRVYERVRPLVADLTHGIEWALAIAAHCMGGLVKVPVIGYRWRIHDRNSFWLDPTKRSFGENIARQIRA